MSNHSQIAESISDAYFTPPESSAWCVKVLKDFNWVNVLTTTLEPCVGSGSLANQLPGKVIGCDLIDHGYPGVIVGDYLEAPERSVDLVFTNPPFGISSEGAVVVSVSIILSSSDPAVVVSSWTTCTSSVMA